MSRNIFLKATQNWYLLALKSSLFKLSLNYKLIAVTQRRNQGMIFGFQNG